MRKQLLFQAVGLLLLNLGAFGQRVDVALERSDNHRAVAMGHWGLLHHHNSGNTWRFTRYDTAMKVIWQTGTEIAESYRYRGQEIDAGKIYILMSKYNDPVFTLITIDLQTGKLNSSRFTLFKKLKIMQFRVLNERIFLGCQVDGLPVSLMINIEENFRSQNLISNLSTKARFCSIEKDTTFDIVSISILEEKNGINYLITKSYTILGQELLSFKVDITAQGKYPLTGSINYTQNYEAVVTGTYSSKPDGFAEGIYIAKFSGEKREYLKFYGFGDMPNFNEYEPEHRRRKSSDKKQQILKQGKDFRLEYMLLTHKPMLIGSQLIFVAEVYNPVFQTENADVMVGTVRHPVHRAELDQYEFTHFMTIAIEVSQGELVWDHTFSLHRTFVNVLNYSVNSKAVANGVYLAYFTPKGLHSYFISSKGEQTEQTAILPKSGKILKNHFTNIQDWYAENLMIWGYQTFENRNKKQQRAFYFTKMQLQK